MKKKRFSEEQIISSLKTERTRRKNYQTRDEARADVFDYIERFYNPRRRHSTRGQISPDQFEKAQMSLRYCPRKRAKPTAVIGARRFARASE